MMPAKRDRSQPKFALWAGAALAAVRVSEWVRDRPGERADVVDLRDQIEEDPA